MNRFKIFLGFAMIVFSGSMPANGADDRTPIKMSNDDLDQSSRRVPSIKLSNQNERLTPSSNSGEENFRRASDQTKIQSRSTHPNGGKMVSSKPGDIQAAKEAYAMAQKGDVEAQCKLAYSYRHGKGIEQNDAEALKWYLKSANKGYGPAMSELTDIYANGLLGVPKDIEKAYWWECVNKLTPRYGGQKLMVVGGGSTKFVNTAWDDFKSVEHLLSPIQKSRAQERAKNFVDQLPQNRKKIQEEKQREREQAEVDRAVKQQEREHQESLNELRRNAAASAESLRNVLPEDPDQSSRVK